MQTLYVDASYFFRFHRGCVHALTGARQANNLGVRRRCLLPRSFAMRRGSWSGSSGRICRVGRFGFVFYGSKKDFINAQEWAIFQRNQSYSARAWWPSWRSRVDVVRGVARRCPHPRTAKKLKTNNARHARKRLARRPTRRTRAARQGRSDRETLSEFYGIRHEVLMLKRLTTGEPAEQMAEFPVRSGLF